LLKRLLNFLNSLEEGVTNVLRFSSEDIDFVPESAQLVLELLNIMLVPFFLLEGCALHLNIVATQTIQLALPCV